jgi:hypothetical protein
MARHTTYAEWFVWAMRHVEDERRSHAAAHAATSALEGGITVAQAAPIAQRAAESADAATAPIRADAFTQAYAAWYAWANIDRNLDQAASHRAANAGTQAQMNGATQAQAAAAAIKAVSATVPMAVMQPRRYPQIWMDPGFHEILWGLACIAAPFNPIYPIVLPIAPILGLVYGGLSLVRGHSRLWLAVPGLILNFVALLLTALLLFHK